MNRVLVTGANGFVGRHVISALSDRTFEIHAVSRHVQVSLDTHVKWHQADIFEQSQVSLLMKEIRPTHLIHLAWEATPGQYWNSVNNFHWVEATLCLTRHFRANGGQRMIAVGTCAEYEWLEGYLNEQSSSLVYNSPYAACKNYVRTILQDYSEQTGLSFVWGRLFFLYGPYEAPTRLVPSIIQSLLKHQEAKCSNATHKRDFLYVVDAANALVTLLVSEITGAVNIASGEAIEVKRIIQIIADKLNGRELIQWGTIHSHILEPPLVQGTVERLNEIGWYPRMDIESGLEQTIRWWREEMRGEYQ
jgi:UDP-glucose 4-epimerase